LSPVRLYVCGSNPHNKTIAFILISGQFYALYPSGYRAGKQSTGCLKPGDTAGGKGEQQFRQKGRTSGISSGVGRLPLVENGCRPVLPLN